MLVNTSQYDDTVDLVQDSETEDPQLVSRSPCVGQNHGKTMSKESIEDPAEWDHFLDRTHLQVFQPQHWRKHANNANATFDSGRQHHRCRNTGRWMVF